MQQNQQDSLRQVVKEKLQSLFEDIQLSSSNQEIIDLITKFLSNQNDEDEKQSMIIQIVEKYSDQPFIELIQIQNMQQSQKQTKFISVFEESKQKMEKQRLIQIFSLDDFWKLALLPEQIKSRIGVLSKLDPIQFFLVLEIAEYSINRIKFSQHQLLKKLLEIKFGNNEKQDNQKDIEQIVGSLLTNQIYELEIYINTKAQLNIEEYKQTVLYLQDKQRNIELKSIAKSRDLYFLYELFAPNLQNENLSSNLKSYLKRKLQITSDQFDQQLIINQLEEFIRQERDFDELYFKIVVYFWGQFCNYIMLKQSEIKKNQIDKKKILTKFFSENEVKKSIIPSYFLDRFVIYEEKLSYSQMFELTQFESSQDNIKSDVKNIFEKIRSSPNYSFEIAHCYNIQKLTHYSLNSIILNNYFETILLKILWMNNIDCLKKDSFSQLQQSKELLQVEYHKQLPMILEDSEYLKVDLLALQIIKSRQQAEKQRVQQEQPLNYFRFFQISQFSLEMSKCFKDYPQNMEIQLEDFNISLAEFTQSEKNVIIDNWTKQTNDKSAFSNLIPFYFNIIKRGESDALTNLIEDSFIRQKIASKSLNIKALFQIFFNNSSEELKMSIIKLHSKYNPVPLLFPKPFLEQINSEFDLFTLNHFIYYIFPGCYPIINFSLSRIQTRYGKTQLLNQAFYQGKRFQEKDSCLLNNNTIDIMFDIEFDGSRNLAVADTHGKTPKEVFMKILPLFSFWIIQMNSENELKENEEALKQILKELPNVKPQICMIIRNSIEYEKVSEFKIQLLENQSAQILRIQDLSNIDEIKVKQQYKKTQHFLFSQIYQYSQEKEKYLDRADQQLKTKNDFANLIDQFSTEDISNKIRSDTELQNKLIGKLNSYFQSVSGFYNYSAFPIRSIENEVTIKEAELKINDEGRFNKEKFKELNKQIVQLKESLLQQAPSELINLFLNIFKQNDFYIGYLWFTSTVQEFNKNNQIQFSRQREEMEQDINQSKSSNLSKAEINKKESKLQAYNQLIHQKTINIETFWRELIKLSQFKKNSVDLNVVKIVYELIKKGEPFEFLNGDDLDINKEFIQELALQFNRNDEKVLILSALGPQSSGKSTVLNKIFGCHFLTSVGRTTKGINLQLLNVRNKQIFHNKFDFILLLDTEGLQSPNQKDPEFDQKIALLILAVSDIIFLIVKGDLHKVVKDLIETCIYTLSQIKESFNEVKQLIWCFNQNNDLNNKQLYKNQLQEIIENIKQVHKDEKIDFANILSDENIQILGFTAVDKRLCDQWNYYENNDTFSKLALKNFIDILKKFAKRLVESKSNLYGIKCFVKEISKILETIQQLPDLLEFSELRHKQKNRIMHEELEIIWGQEKENLSQKVQQLNLKKKIEEWTKYGQNKDYHEIFAVSEISEKIKHTCQSLQEKLGEIRDKNQIPKKIYQKYMELIDMIKNQVTMEYQFLITEEISSQKIKLFESSFKKKLDSYITTLDAEKILMLQKQPQLLDSEFENLWRSHYQDQESWCIQLYEDYEKNLIDIFKIEKQDFDLRTNNTVRELNFFRENLNKNIPNEKEKSLIYSELQQKWVKDQNGLMVIQRDQRYIQYSNIFHKDLREKIKLQKEQTCLIKLTECFNMQQKLIIINKAYVQPYIVNDLLKDFIILSKNQKITSSEIYCFFLLLDMLKIVYNKKSLDIFIHQILSIMSENLSEQKIQHIGQSFMKELKFDPSQRIVLQNDYFINNFNLYYRSLQYNQANSTEFQFFDPDLAQYFPEYFLDSHIVIISECNINPRIELEEDKQFYQYIMSPIENKKIKKKFESQFADIFNKMMLKSPNGWELLFSRVYDLIKQSFQSDSLIALQGKMKIQNIDQIKKISEKVEQEIRKFDQQFAFFGIILRQVGERYIKYSSLLILWRYFCLSKEKRLRKICQDPEEFSLKKQQKEKFRSKIETDKILRSTNQAKTLCTSFLKGLLNKYYKEHKTEVMSLIQSNFTSSYEIIKKLDQQLLINQSIQFDSIIQYISNHRTYLNDYVRKQIDDLIKHILRNHQREFDKLVKQSFENLILDITTLSENFAQVDAAKDCFSNNLNCQESDYEKFLYDIIFKYFLRDESQYIVLIKVDYQKVFREVKKSSISLSLQFVQEEQEEKNQISSLFPFFKELKSLCLSYSQQQNKEELSLENFEVEKLLAELEQQMLGCQEICPLCGRKCDQNNLLNFEHQHACRNGHQIRGMIGVLLQGKPSLYSCEEIKDDDIFVIQSTNIMIKWDEFKKNFSEWDFVIYDDNQIQHNLNKMFNVWNGQIGAQLCRMNKIKYEQKKVDQRYHYEHEENAHYILVIEDSTLINQNEWEDIQLATFQIMKKILKSEFSKLSLIQYNQEARVVIDCDFVNQPFQPLIRNAFLSANFEIAFDQVLTQLNNHVNQSFERIIVIFQTKGILQFPQKQISALSSLHENFKQLLTFRFYSFIELDLDLDKVIEALTNAEFTVEKYQIQNSDFIKEIWAEKISSSKIFQY